MAWTKFKTAAVVGVIALLAVGTTSVVVHTVRAPAKVTPLAFAGYAKPETSVQSTIWAASTGDLEKTLAGLTAEEAERFKSKMAGQSDDEIKRTIIAWANGMAGYAITQKEIISDDEVLLRIHAPPSADALHDGKAAIIMRKIGNEWKKARDVN